MQVLPLQVASLLLVTLPWTLPRLLDLQAANPVAVLDGTHTLTHASCRPHDQVGQGWIILSSRLPSAASSVMWASQHESCKPSFAMLGS